MDERTDRGNNYIPELSLESAGIKLFNFFKTLDLINAWHCKNPNSADFTWCDAQTFRKSRIVYIFEKNDCIDRVKI